MEGVRDWLRNLTRDNKRLGATTTFSDFAIVLNLHGIALSRRPLCPFVATTPQFPQSQFESR